MQYFRLLLLPLLLLCACNDTSLEDVAPTPDPAVKNPTCGSSISVIPNRNDWPGGPDLEGGRIVALDGRCLVVEYTWVGCSDQGLPLRLVTDGGIGDSAPYAAAAQLRFSENTGPTLCAIFTNQLDTFDLSTYLGTDDLPANLTIFGADTTVLVE